MRVALLNSKTGENETCYLHVHVQLCTSFIKTLTCNNYIAIYLAILTLSIGQNVNFFNWRIHSLANSSLNWFSCIHVCYSTILLVELLHEGGKGFFRK